MARSKFNFAAVVKNLKQTQGLMRLLASDSKNYFVGAFKKEGWDGESWAPVQRKIVGTKAYKYPGKPKQSAHTRPILIGTGKMRKAVANMQANVSATKAVFTLSDVNYAIYHNEGDGQEKRKFIGDAKELRKIQIDRIKRFTDKAWRA